MKEVCILVGLPNSGKTTYANKHKKNYVVISADQVRKLVYGQKFFEGGEPLVWAIRNIALKMLMEQGKNILIDETNTTVERREPIIELAQEYGYTIKAVFFNVSKEECISRARKEGNDTIIPIIERMANQLQTPSLDEGVDKIIEA